MKSFRECGACSACCSGVLKAPILNTYMGPKKCLFHCGKCLIYPIRPEVCVSYQCLWSQFALPESFRPDKIGLLVSVENYTNGQFLRIIKLKENIEQSHLDIIIQFSQSYDTPYVIVETNGDITAYGPDEFIRYYTNKT